MNDTCHDCFCRSAIQNRNTDGVKLRQFRKEANDRGISVV
jgi:hypothetical protein